MNICPSHCSHFLIKSSQGLVVVFLHSIAPFKPRVITGRDKSINNDNDAHNLKILPKLDQSIRLQPCSAGGGNNEDNYI